MIVDFTSLNFNTLGQQNIFFCTFLSGKNVRILVLKLLDPENSRQYPYFANLGVD